MPYNRANENECTEVFVTDPEALAEIEREKIMCLEMNGEELTTEEILSDWNANTYMFYNVVQVRSGEAFRDGTIPESYETLPTARAEAYNWYQSARRFGCDEDNFVVEIRKHTYSRNACCVQKSGDDCWYSITLNVELVDTIRMN
jgi:hypothetical protein